MSTEIETATATSSPPSPKIRHEWYQTDSDVVVSIFVKNVRQEDLKVEFEENALSLNYRLPTGSEAAFDLVPLSHPIDIPASSFKVLSTKIEVKLAKQHHGLKWGKLEGEDQGITGVVNTSTATKAKPAYPTSSARKTNWEHLEAEVKKEEDAPAESKDPNAAGGDRELNKLFQKLYSGATDDQRMAMMKSYQESNGTALSTNWDDVKKKRVETTPPDSMIAKKWNQ